MIFQTPLFGKKKRDGPSITHEMSLFAGHGFYRESDNKPHLRFHMKKATFLSIE
jgi:hypothetical protein